MADYKPGSMNIASQERTFDGFVKFATRAVIVIIAVLILMALADG